MNLYNDLLDSDCWSMIVDNDCETLIGADEPPDSKRHFICGP
jgi:hypothetical protein